MIVPYLLIPSIALSFYSCVTVTNQSIFQKVQGFVLRHTQERIEQEIPVENLSSTIILKNNSGSISIDTCNTQKIILKATKRCAQKSMADTTVSITPKSSRDIEISTQSLNGAKEPCAVDYTIMMPKSCSLKIEQDTGDVFVKNGSNQHSISLLNGSVQWQGSSSALTIKAPNGAVECTVTHMPENAYVSINAGSTITMALPTSYATDLHAHSLQGSIQSTIPITIQSFTTTLNSAAWKKFKQEVRGFIRQEGKGYMELHAYRSISITEKKGS